MEDRWPRGGPAQVLRRKYGRWRGRPSLNRSRGLKGRSRGAGRRLQRAQAQHGTATHSPATDTSSKRVSRGRRYRMGKDTCKQERKSSFNRQHGLGGWSKRSSRQQGEAEDSVTLIQAQAQATSSGLSAGTLTCQAEAPPLGPTCPPLPSQDCTTPGLWPRLHSALCLSRPSGLILAPGLLPQTSHEACGWSPQTGDAPGERNA